MPNMNIRTIAPLSRTSTLPIPDPTRYRQKPSATIPLIVITLLFLGLAYPTSQDGITLLSIYYASLAVLALLYLAIHVTNRRPLPQGLLYGMLSFLLLMFFTVFTPMPRIAPSIGAHYFLLFLLLPLNLKNLGHPVLLRQAFLFVNLVILIVNFLCLADVEVVKAFLITYYSAFNTDMVAGMLSAGKPVFTFGSHAIAAFAYFLLAILNIRTYMVRRSFLNLAFAICYAIFLPPLACVSAYVYLPLSALSIAFAVHKTSSKPWFSMIFVLGCAASVMIYEEPLRAGLANYAYLWEAPASGGFEGRYARGGSVRGNIDFILDNPFRPVGLGWSEWQFFGDSGFLEFLLRGSLPLMLCLYRGFFLFLNNNIASKRDQYLMFLVFMSFEMAYANLLHVRTLALLPFVVVYLNGLTSDDETGGGQTETARRDPTHAPSWRRDDRRE